MNTISGFILVGGASSRMGTDKALLKLGGQTFIQRIARELSPVTSSVTLVGRDNASALSGATKLAEPVDPKLPIIADVYERWGALGGVHAALTACQSVWALVVACDLPFVTTPLFARLAEMREDFDSVVPVQNDGRPQPLCALYARTPCLLRTEELIKSSERKPLGLLQSVRTRWVGFNELEDLTGANRFFDNVNTPQDYARAIEEGVSARDVVAQDRKG